ncbi:MAG: aa3-type cytochrome oxidase subunit IV [Actinomycetota bacterium]
MTTGAKVFLGSAAFGAAVAGAYWVVSYEPTGTVLLGFFGVAPLLVAGYVALKARGTRRDPEDRPEATPAAAADEPLGEFAVESVWPVVLAAGAALVGGGLVFGLWLFVVGALVTAIAVVGFTRE